MTDSTTATKPVTKLQLRDDGSALVPLKGREPIELEEPTMRELASMHTALAAADEGLPALPTLQGLGENPGPAEVEVFRSQLAEYNKVARDRAVALYGDADTAPHGQAFLQIVRTLSGDDTITVDQLYGWAMNPNTGRQLLAHFTAPLGGQADVATD